jgi:hypothetical protein
MVLLAAAMFVLVVDTTFAPGEATRGRAGGP